MTKKFLNILAIIAILVTGCDKKLDLLPLQSIDESVALANDANIRRVLNGAYDGMSSGSLYGGDLLLYAELLAADAELAWRGTFNQPREIFGKNILVTNSYVNGTWLNGYRTINIANNVLEGVDKLLPANKDRVQGEATFIRGVMYFELVKLFGKPYSAGNVATNLGVPLVTTPTRGVGEELNLPRATVQAIYEQVISDLTTAEGLLPIANANYARKAAAAAMLSRVYLQMERYQDALAASNRAIGYGGRTLTSTYAAAFNTTSLSSEALMIISVNQQDGANTMHLFWSVPTFGGRDGDVDILQKHLDLYEAGDARRALFYVGAGGNRSGKWQLQFRNLSIIRLAEMHLTRAECNFRLNSTTGATPLADINAIRARVGLPAKTTLTLAEILMERRLELAHEGHAIHDARRTKRTVDGFAFDSDKLVFPIPNREINANPNLVQNPGYN